MALAGVLAFRKRHSQQIGPKPRANVDDALAADDLLDAKTSGGDHAHDDRRSSAEENGMSAEKKGGVGAPGSMAGKNPLYAGGGGRFGAAVSVSFARMICLLLSESRVRAGRCACNSLSYEYAQSTLMYSALKVRTILGNYETTLFPD